MFEFHKYIWISHINASTQNLSKGFLIVHLTKTSLQHKIQSLLLSREDLDWEYHYVCLQPSDGMLRDTVCSSHAILHDSTVSSHTIKRLAWGYPEASLVVPGCVNAEPLVNSFDWCLLSLAAFHSGGSVDGLIASCSEGGHTSLFSRSECSWGTLTHRWQGDISFSGKSP